MLNLRRIRRLLTGLADRAGDGDLLEVERLSQVRLGLDFPRIDIPSHSDFVDRKLRLISSVGTAESIRDFGGLYIVNGKYLLDSALELGCSFAHEIDGSLPAGWEEAKSSALLRDPNLRIEYSRKDFRRPDLYSSLEPVDVSILFEVLLHQENYVEVIGNVIGKTRKYVCVAQPCLKERLFRLPASAVCLQFYDEELKDLLRQQSCWPKQPSVDKFDPVHWVWGHTTSHLVTIFKGFGWEIDAGEVDDKLWGRYWDYPLMRFRKATP